MIFFSLPPIQYRHPPSHLPSQKKKNQRFRKHFFFSFHQRCCKNENLWWFSPYPVTTTIIWPTTDRIPHSLIFKRMQIKRIADNIRAFSFLVTNWNKEPDEERIYHWTEFFHNSPVKLWFSIKLIATEFFSTPFNCWMAVWQHTKNPPKSGRWNMRKLAIKIFNSHHRKPNIRKITNSDKTCDNCVLFSQEVFDITSLVYFG